MSPEPWKPRSSSVGYYFNCDYRAAYDRAIHEGVAAPEIRDAAAANEAKPKPHAALGTCIHFTIQDGIRATFPGDPLLFQPTPAEWESAGDLVPGGSSAVPAHCVRVARYGASLLPPGRRWLAETAWKTRNTRGSIDLLTDDYEELWDIKTASRPPDHGRIKPAHLYQVMNYRNLVCDTLKRPVVQRGGILYLHAMGDWAVVAPFDFASDAALELADHTREYVKFLRSKKLYASAVPRLGAHCSTDFCPYTDICKNRFIPPAVETLYARSSRKAPSVTSVADMLASR